MISSFSPQIDFAKAEHEILKFWDEANIFERSVAERDPNRQFVFYDGPPFATGLPHAGNLLASVIKDIIPRYWTMKSYRVERRFGWDCHGLPIEYEIDKSLGLEDRRAIENFGIGNYNHACRNIVLKYTAEWEKTVHRIGRWVDFKRNYKTMDASFMESVWWVFKQLWDKGLIYEGYKVMPYSTTLATPLSNFEAGLNYKDVQDPSLIVLFKKVHAPETYLLAWTTTPWTLPSNLALAVHPKEPYAEIEDLKTKKHYILAQKRLELHFPDKNSYKLLTAFPGKSLMGTRYEPLFPYFKDTNQAFQILEAEFVRMEEGTGIVHMAPGFGEDDFYVCQKAKIPVICPVDANGKFTKEVSDYQGLLVKNADKAIIARLKEEGKILKHETIVHSYPFCPRSETPLIYRAISSWFVKVESIKDRLIAANQKTNWVPTHLKEGRFGKWLEEARDWAISRNRYWGCTIPLWKNSETEKVYCVGSIQELALLSGKKITDLHREFIDDITFQLKGEKGRYRRIPEVLDCWFESGAMPYAQAHYPFENKTAFEKNFPADFIGEGLDQTRGWFYTLTILGTVLFNQSPFKNVIVNGLILAEDGKKMSKRLKNYPDPQKILETYGADAFRLYMINSALLRAEELRFSEKGIEDIVRRVLLKWWNSYSFYMSYAQIEAFFPKGFTKSSSNVLDRWILSRLQSLIAHTQCEMNEYRLYTVVPALIDFIEDLTNTYIRLNRDRFWNEEGNADKWAAFETLHQVLFEFTKIMAPFTPFLSERIYVQLAASVPSKMDSVHLERFPTPNSQWIDRSLEDTVYRLQHVLVMGRNLREKIGAKIKIPLKELKLIHRDRSLLKSFEPLENYLKQELNVRKISYDHEEHHYVTLQAKPNHKRLGPRLGKNLKNYLQKITNLSPDDILKLEVGGDLKISDETFSRDDIEILRIQTQDHPFSLSNPFMTVALDNAIEEDQILEGQSREVINRIQKLRKNANLNLNDRIEVQYKTDDSLTKAIEYHQENIATQVLAKKIEKKTVPQGSFKEQTQVDEHSLEIAISVYRK
ncbi:MAG: isoleucine--tRNA ligase [Deltaproteobacteria bacterium]|nr:isoleucine--tRNA ligase [Deltaproteobacteria bacterium]